MATRVKKILGQKTTLALITVAAAMIVYLVLILSQVPFIRVGENHHYGVYVNDTKIGTYDLWVEGETTVDGTKAFTARYIAAYAIGTDNYGQAGRMTFEADDGRLRHFRVALAKNLDLKWLVDVTYSPTLSVMQVIVENYEDNTTDNNLVSMQRETTVLEHLNYLLRFEPLRFGYAKRVDLNSFPDATNIYTIVLEVTGENRIQVPAGTFDSWVIESEELAITIWVAKDGRAVPMFEERMSSGETWRYKLESL